MTGRAFAYNGAWPYLPWPLSAWIDESGISNFHQGLSPQFFQGECNRRKADAAPPEPVAVAVVKCWSAGWQRQFNRHRARAIDAAGFVLEHFADAALNDKPLAYPPEASLQQLRVIDALYESARSGKRVELQGMEFPA